MLETLAGCLEGVKGKESILMVYSLLTLANVLFSQQ